MAKLPKLTPFWYEPEGQDDEGEKVRFLLRPLTQQQMVDVEEHYVDGRITGKAQYIAGKLGIVQVQGAYHPQTNQPAVPPSCFEWLDRTLVKLCGLRLIIEDRGLDWDQIMKPLREGAAAEPAKPEETDEGN